jgi:hypothetical protein
VQTWETYRRVLGKDFRILQDAKEPGFVLKDEIQSIKTESFAKTIEWYEDFDTWQRNDYTHAIRSSVPGLINELKTISEENNRYISSAVKSKTDLEREYSALIMRLNTLQEGYTDLQKGSDSRPEVTALDQKMKEINLRIGNLANIEVILKDRQQDINRLQSLLGRLEEYGLSSTFVSFVADVCVIRPLVNEINRVTIPLKEGNRLTKISLTSIFVQPIEHLVAGTDKRYRAFRLQRQKESKWYLFQEKDTSDIHPLEFDILLLVILRTVHEMIDYYWDDMDNSTKGLSALKPYIDFFCNQVLVDEATDFSPVQLACMAALAHPRLNSFFACGDFNQRITSWGTRSHDELKWVFSDYDTREITIGYRQSQQLNDFAKAIIHAVDGTQAKIVLPDRSDNLGVAPVLQEHAKGEMTISWLAERICEIEKSIDLLPSTAIFVNSESEVSKVATALDTLLAEYNMKVVACHGGQILGQGNDVRVFDIQHIKGLEFEAVFFVGIDRLASQLPDLFDKYLYVGATRAATYLGITCEGTLPPPLDKLRGHFGNDWNNPE